MKGKYMSKSSNAAVTTEGDQESEPPGRGCLCNPSSQTKLQTNQTPTQASFNWNDWRWQIRNRIRTVEQLEKFLPSLSDQQDLRKVAAKYPLAITPYYASLIQRPDTSDPVFAMCVPQVAEMYNPPCLCEDPLEEREDMPVPGLVHRYPDRALVMVTTACASYCRHCTRKRVAGKREISISPSRLEQVADYLTAHPEISDVILSGGDPLTMATGALEAVISRIRSIDSVQIIRIGTRVPVVLPMRITDDLVNMLRKYHPIWLNMHFNHPAEITKETVDACAKLADAGIPLGNQTVLLRGVNDNPKILERLFRSLIRMRVRPYYLYQCDLVQGVEHFRTPLSRGIEIMEYLRGRISGMAIPNFVVDAPHGGGKIPLLPNYIISMSPTHTVLRNYEGLMANYPEPGAQNQSDTAQEPEENAGVWELASGQASVIQPAQTVRGQRRQKISEKRKNLLTDDNALLFDL
jgi:lysine 2,3-aminomutase